MHYSVLQILSLIATLYEPNRKLPALWKVVKFLRRMDAFSPHSTVTLRLPILVFKASGLSEINGSDDLEADEVSGEEQIALPFLIRRESCLKSVLESSGSNINRLTKDGKLDLARYLKKDIAIWREGVYDVITQYSIIFLKRASSSNLDSQRSPTKAPRQSEKPSAYTALLQLTHLLPMLFPSLPLLSSPTLITIPLPITTLPAHNLLNCTRTGRPRLSWDPYPSCSGTP